MTRITRETFKSLSRRVGFDVVRWHPSFTRMLLPMVGEALSPLELAVPSLLADRADFFFVQIGANNGVRADPLRSLVVRYHLRGLMVEPLRDVFVELKRNYASETQLAFANVAIATQNGEATLFRFKPEAPVPDWAHGLATWDGDKIRRIARDWKLDHCVEEARVRTVTFAGLLNEYSITNMALLQIDTEGFDLEVIKMALRTGVRPALVNYEFIHLSLEDRLESCRLLAACGYCFLHGPTDTLAVLGDGQ